MLKGEAIARALTLYAAVGLIAGCGDPAPAWHSIGDELDRAALAVTGVNDKDIYVVGGPLGAAGDALALHYDGEAWTELGQSLGGVTLWWAWAAPSGATDVWMVGEQGTIARWNGVELATLSSGTTSTLFGVWGTSSDDVWIVGGDPIGDGEVDVVLHYDGVELVRETVPARDAALFKVWGAGDQLFVSGQAGTMLQRTPSGWVDRSAELDTVASILTVHGCSAQEVYAVGGRDVFFYDGTEWAVLGEPAVLGFVNGVSCAEAGVLVVGNSGLKWRYDRASGEWINHQFDRPFDQDLHGGWVSPTGRLWVVGGNFNLPAGAAPRVGRIGVYAATPPPSL